MSKMNKGRIISWMLVASWMLVIFSFSAEEGKISSSRSRQLTKAVTQYSAQLPDKVKKNINSTKLIELIIRKGAHVLEYLILTILLLFALSRSRLKKRNSYILAASLAILYACIDELHQSFTPGRDGRVSDVFIDSIGVILGLFLFFISGYLKRMVFEKRKLV